MKNRLKEARLRAMKSQIRLWLETGVHFSTISRIECGYLDASPDQKGKLAAALRVDVDWLFPSQECAPTQVKNDI